MKENLVESPVANRLIESFPHEKDLIEDLYTRFVTSVFETIQVASSSSEGLPQKVISSAENFYRLKAEKQLRGLLLLGIKRTLIKFADDLEMMYKEMRKRGRELTVVERVASVQSVEFLGEGEIPSWIKIPFKGRALREGEQEKEEYLLWNYEDIEVFKAGVVASLPYHEVGNKKKFFEAFFLQTSLFNNEEKEIFLNEIMEILVKKDEDSDEKEGEEGMSLFKCILNKKERDFLKKALEVCKGKKKERWLQILSLSETLEALSERENGEFSGEKKKKEPVIGQEIFELMQRVVSEKLREYKACDGAGEMVQFPFREAIRIIQKNPGLEKDLKSRFENDVFNRERYSKRKIRETIYS